MLICNVWTMCKISCNSLQSVLRGMRNFSWHINTQLFSNCPTQRALQFVFPMRKILSEFRYTIPLNTNNSMNSSKLQNKCGRHLISSLALVNQAINTKHNLIKNKLTNMPFPFSHQSAVLIHANGSTRYLF